MAAKERTVNMLTLAYFSFFFPPVAGFCSTADVPAASVCVLPAGTGGSGCRWHAALLQPAAS